MRATLAEVGTRLADAGDTVAAIGITNQRETVVAFDRATGRPLHRAIVWQDRRTAARCAELAEAGHLPLRARHRPGSCSTRTSRPPRWPGCSATAASRSAAHDPDLAFGTVDTWVLWNLTGGARGGTYATDPSNASRTLLLDTATLAWSDELCDLFGVPPQSLPEVRPSCGRFGTVALDDLGPASGVLDGVPVSGVPGDQQAALFGQACFEPGMAKVTYGTGSFVLANVGPERPPAPDGLTVSCAWDLGDHGDATPRSRRLRPRGVGLRRRRGHPVAARRARHHRVRRRDRPAGRVGARQRRRHRRARVHRARQPVVGSPGRAASSPASPRAPAARTWPAPASRPWRSRCAT